MSDHYDDHDTVETGRLTITRRLTDTDEQVGLNASEGLSVLEGLGMIELAKDTWLRTNGLRDTPNDD